MRQPSIDSATWKAIMTLLQALLAFSVGLILAVWQVPGVPKAVMDFVWNNGPTVFLSVGLPLSLGAGIISFLINWLFRKGIQTY